MSTWNKRTSLKVLQHRLPWHYWRYMHILWTLCFYYTLIRLVQSLAITVPSLTSRMLSPSKFVKLNKTFAASSLSNGMRSLKLSMCCPALKKTYQPNDFGTLKFVFSLNFVVPLTFRQNACCPVWLHLLKPYLVHVELLKSFSKQPCTISRYHFMLTLYGCNYC